MAANCATSNPRSPRNLLDAFIDRNYQLSRFRDRMEDIFSDPTKHRVWRDENKGSEINFEFYIQGNLETITTLFDDYHDAHLRDMWKIADLVVAHRYPVVRRYGSDMSVIRIHMKEKGQDDVPDSQEG